MASSGNYESKIAGGSTGGYYIGIDWKINSQTTNPPKSNVTASVYVRSSGNGYTISSSTSKDISITINGTKYTGTNTIGIGANSKKVLLTKTVDVSHNSDGTKSCSFAGTFYVGFTLSGTSLTTVSTSGTGTFNSINVNSAPYFDSSAYITVRENNSSGRVISSAASGTENASKFPENVANLYISWPAAKDNESTSGMKYVLFRQVNDGSWSEVQNSTATSYTHPIQAGNPGQSLDYYVYAVDSGGLKSSNINATQVQKNVLTPATLSVSGSIAHSTGNQTITIGKSGASNTYTTGAAINYSLSAKINNTNITVYNPTATGNLTIVPTTGSVSNPHIRLGDIRNALSGSSYNGTLVLTLTTSNGWGSSGTSSKNVSVDLRTNPVAGSTGTAIDSSSYYTIPISGTNTNFLVPSKKQIKLTWGAASDPNGTPITYRVEQQIGTGSWTTLKSSTSDTFYSFNVSVSGKPSYKWRVYAKNSYGRETLLSNTPGGTLYNYSAPSLSITSTSRTSNNLTVNFSASVSTEITTTNAIKSIRWVFGAKNGTVAIANRSFTITGLTEDDSGSFSITMDDTIGTYLGQDAVTVNGSVSKFYPILSLRSSGVGINTVPTGSNVFVVNGASEFTGALASVYSYGITTKKSTVSHWARMQTSSTANEVLFGLASNPNTDASDYIRVGINKLQYKTGATTHDILYSTGGVVNLTPSSTAFSANTKGEIFGADATVRSGISFGAASGNNDPGCIYHETSSATASVNRGVLHLCPTDDADNANDYVTIHGSNDPENIKLYTGGNIRATGGLDLGGSAIIGGSVEAKAESKFYIGSYSDPLSGTSCAIKVTGSIALSSSVHCKDWFRSYESKGWYNQTYGGGIYMQDSTWVRTYGSKGFYCNNTLKGTRLESEGEIKGTSIQFANNDTISYDDTNNIFLFKADDSTGSSKMQFGYLWTACASGAEGRIGGTWSGSAGTEFSFYNTKGNGWGFIGNVDNKWFRVYGSSGSVSDRNLKYEITKASTEEQYENVKSLNIYNYRSISTIVDEETNKITDTLKRQDLSLGTMVDELPLETTFYDNEGGENGDKAVDMYSYTTMILGALKETINKVEALERELEEIKNGTIN